MNNYSIVRIGNEYVVRADDKSVLKVASRRRAVQLISTAVELLNSEPPPAEPSPGDVEANEVETNEAS